MPASLLDAYLADLPDGLSSHPGCKAKVSVLRSALDVLEVEADPSWPEPIRELIEEPPPMSVWIPEVLNVGAHLAIVDANHMDDDAVIDWGYRSNQRLAQSKLYRVLTHLATPPLLLRAARLSWTVLHRGVDVAVSLDGDKTATVSVTHPPHVWTELVHRSTAQGFQAALEISQGEAVEVQIEDLSATHCDYRCSWT